MFRRFYNPIKKCRRKLRQELEITIADMKSGNEETALTRLESRIGSTMLSDVVRGLISVKRGDNGVMYFEMLNHALLSKWNFKS